MKTLEHLRQLRAQQAIRLANATRFTEAEERERLRRIDELLRLQEAA